MGSFHLNPKKMSLPSFSLLGLMVMLHMCISSAAPRPKTYLVDTADLGDNIEPKGLGHLGLDQGNDYGLEESETTKDKATEREKKCRKKYKYLKKCEKKYTGCGYRQG